MRSIESFKTESRGQKPGKINASLSEKLNHVEWGEYRLWDLFEVVSSKKRFDANKVVIYEHGKYPYIVRMGSNNGQRGYIDENVSFLNDGNTISFGQDTATMYYQEKPYFTGDKIKILKPKFLQFNKNNAQFFLTAMRQSFSSFAWGSSSFNVSILENQSITLPATQNKEINFKFMESFIAELEAYFKVTGLDDYELNNEEVIVLNEFNSNDIELDSFKFREIFNNIEQGRRLKKSDQCEGTLPFVMSGVTNTGIVGYISNPVASFPKNSITVDIFGNAFYRNYNFGAGDDTGVYWSDNIAYSQETMLYFTAAMDKALAGKFSYGYKLRSSQSFDFEMILPSKNHVPNFRKINILISAIKKLVIKDVIIYADNKISATKKCIHN